MDSPISALPDIPVLTPGALSTPTSMREKRSSLTTASPTPINSRGSLYGPRLMPSSSTKDPTSPAVSPGKLGYYDNRNSWRSEYSLNVMDFEEDDEMDDYHSFKENDPFVDTAPDSTPVSMEPFIPNPYITRPPPQMSSEQSKAPLDLANIEIPEIRNALGSLPKHTNKDLPELPQESGLSLPSLPFSSRSLSVVHFSQCESPALLSNIFQWSLKLVDEWSEGLLVSQTEYKKSLKLLFKHAIPKMNLYAIDSNIEAILASFDRQNAIYIDENDTVHFFENNRISGVFPQLTGCYSKLHADPDAKYQCYSSRCSLTIYQPPVPMVPSKQSGTDRLGEWTAHWNLTAQDLEDLDEEEVKKQSHIFELIRQQQNIIRLGEIQVAEYGKSFKSATPQLLPDVSKFYNDAFNTVKPLIELHRKHLLEPLIAKLNTQGKYISGIGEIFLNWAILATVPYLKYTESLAAVRELIKYEKSRQSRFAEWLYQIDQRPAVIGASLDHNRIFFSGFIGHTQLLSLALDSVRKKTKPSDIDYQLLEKAVVEVGKLNRKIDSMQETALQSRQLRVLSKQLYWKSSLLEIDLKLVDPARRLIMKGDVTKKDKWTTSTVYLILLDNYLLITEQQKDSHFKISEKPIPVEFLQVETKDFSASEVPASEGESFPFKIRYSGQSLSYTLYTETLPERDAWFAAFNQVKAKKVESASYEPFKINILSDQFAYEDGQQPQKLPVCAPGSNLDNALTDYEKTMEELFADLSLSRPVMMSSVLCGTTITFQQRTYHVLGLSFGLFISEEGVVRGWRRVLDMNKITQLEQLDGMLVILADKAVYHVNIVSLLLNYHDKNPDGHVVVERLSKRDVSCFRIGSYYNTTLLFILKTPFQTTTPRFKVYTPIFDSFGTFLYFQLYKRFQHSYDCYDISVFNSMFVLHTSKGFEILSFQVLYESQPIPKFLGNMKKPKTELDMIKKMMRSGGSKPLQMTKVPYKPQFYLVYDSFAIVIDTIGQLINDKFIVPFKFRCSKVAFQDHFLICIGVDIIEVFDLSYDDATGFQRFDPVQIITGKDIKLLDKHNAKIMMAHPKMAGRQLVFSLERLP